MDDENETEPAFPLLNSMLSQKLREEHSGLSRQTFAHSVTMSCVSIRIHLQRKKSFQQRHENQKKRC
jgi:hypothetical protein